MAVRLRLKTIVVIDVDVNFARDFLYCITKAKNISGVAIRSNEASPSVKTFYYKTPVVVNMMKKVFEYHRSVRQDEPFA